MVSTSRILVAIVQLCYEAKDWDALNENIMLLSKRRSQLKQVGILSCHEHIMEPVTETTMPYITMSFNRLYQLFYLSTSCIE